MLTLTHSSSPTIAVNTMFDPTALLAAADWLEAHAARLVRPILPGMIVITSARIGPLPLVDGTYVASWDGLDDVEMTVVSPSQHPEII